MAKVPMSARLGEVRLPAELLAQVDAWCKRGNSNRAEYVRRALARQVAHDKRLEKRAAEQRHRDVSLVSGSGE